MMRNDEIVEEIRRIRDQIAERFDYDVRAIADHLRKGQRQHPAKIVKYPPKRLTTRAGGRS